MKPNKETKINIICMIITQIECAGFDMSIVLAIRQFTSMASSLLCTDLGLNVKNANSLEINPDDGYKNNEDRINYLKSRLQELQTEIN